MQISTPFEVIIIGGSYAGLSAAMALGRSLRQVLVIDGGKPCNRQTPASHNFITHDGEKPAAIAAAAKAQVLQYSTVQFREGQVSAVHKQDNGFEVKTEDGGTFTAKKIIFATGLTDVMPAIPGFAECWGITVIHCPYCHGYEVKKEITGIISNGGEGFEYARLISHWTNDLALFTNGPSTLTSEQFEKLQAHKISVIETAISHIEHINGEVQYLHLQNGSRYPLKAIYHRPKMEQSPLLAALGCELTEQGLVKLDAMQRTTVKGVYACGDNSGARAVSISVAAGGFTGMVLNKDLIEESF